MSTGASLVSRLLVSATPLALSVLLVPLLAGPLSLGGGEKDILLTIPLLVWSLLYLIASIVLRWRKMSLWKSAAWSAGVATLLCAVAFVGLLSWAVSNI